MWSNIDRAKTALKTLNKVEVFQQANPGIQNNVDNINTGIMYFAKQTGMEEEGGELKLSDFLCDIMHLCDLSMVQLVTSASSLTVEDKDASKIPALAYFLEYGPDWARRENINYEQCCDRAASHYIEELGEVLCG